MEKWEKNHISRQFSKGGTGIEQSGIGTISILSTGTCAGTGTHYFVLTSISILAITFSFLIRFE